MEFSRQEYWSELPFPSPGCLPNPGIEPRSPALWADSLPSDIFLGNHFLKCINLIFDMKSESEVAQSCPTLCDPVDCSPPGFSIHGIFQAWVLEWVAISFSRGSSWPRSPALQADALPSEPPGYLPIFDIGKVISFFLKVEHLREFYFYNEKLNFTIKINPIKVGIIKMINCHFWVPVSVTYWLLLLSHLIFLHCNNSYFTF